MVDHHRHAGEQALEFGMRGVEALAGEVGGTQCPCRASAGGGHEGDDDAGGGGADQGECGDADGEDRGLDLLVAGVRVEADEDAEIGGRDGLQPQHQGAAGSTGRERDVAGLRRAQAVEQNRVGFGGRGGRGGVGSDREQDPVIEPDQARHGACVLAGSFGQGEQVGQRDRHHHDAAEPALRIEPRPREGDHHAVADAPQCRATGVDAGGTGGGAGAQHLEIFARRQRVVLLDRQDRPGDGAGGVGERELDDAEHDPLHHLAQPRVDGGDGRFRTGLAEGLAQFDEIEHGFGGLDSAKRLLGERVRGGFGAGGQRCLGVLAAGLDEGFRADGDQGGKGDERQGGENRRGRRVGRDLWRRGGHCRCRHGAQPRPSGQPAEARGQHCCAVRFMRRAWSTPCGSPSVRHAAPGPDGRRMTGRVRLRGGGVSGQDGRGPGRGGPAQGKGRQGGKKADQAGDEKGRQVG